MARNYAALPYDYLEEMEALNDAEFGRLTRALLAYSMTGEKIALCGNERFYAKRVMAQEDRFKASYEDVSAVRSEAGKAGAAARWQNGKGIFANGKDSTAIPANGKMAIPKPIPKPKPILCHLTMAREIHARRASHRRPLKPWQCMSARKAITSMQSALCRSTSRRAGW